MRSIVAHALALVACAFAFAARAATDFEKLSAQVAAEEAQIADLEHRAAALLRAPAPMVPAGTLAGPTYLGGGPEVPRFDEHTRLAARHALLVGLDLGKVTEVVYDDGNEVSRFGPPWEKQGFVIAPVEVLVAMRAALSEPFRAVELDLRITSAERGVQLVTLAHELDGSLRVIDIPRASLPPESPPVPLDDATFRTRFGIGHLDAGGSGWSASERIALERALKRLSPRELAQLRGLELRREGRPKVILPMKGACGLSVVQLTLRWIELYDCAFRDDDIVFTGDPRAPELASVRLILREIGHALATAPVAAFNRDLFALSEKGKQTTTDYNQARAELAGIDPKLWDPLSTRLTQVAQRMQAVAKQVNETPVPGPAVVEFSQLPGASGGITSYGRVSAGEAFAEAFSLYRADPEALRRISPAVLAFFEGGKHLAAR